MRRGNRRTAAGLVTGLVALAGCSGPTEPQLVRVTAAGCALTTRSSSGVVVGDGLVATVAHGLGGSTGLSVRGHEARLVAIDVRSDLALVAVPGAHTSIELADDAGAGPVTLHTPEGVVPTTIRRPITINYTGFDGVTHVRDGFEVVGEIVHGDSGSPVLDADGRLVGLMYAVSTGVGGVSYGVSVSELRALLATVDQASPTVSSGACP